MRRTNLLLAIGTIAVATLAFPAAASADHHRYAGMHAISAQDGMCYIEVGHVHAYAPFKSAILFRKKADHYHFVGDPIAFGYDGDKHAYHGHHPHGNDIGGSCYLDGPHFHHYAPAVTAEFELKGDVYWYVGEHEPTYKRYRFKRKRVNAFYTGIHYDRPVIVVDPPAAYAGVVITAPAPRVEVDLLLPSFSFGVAGHAHVGHGHGHVKHKHKRKHYKKHKKRHKKYKKRQKKRRKGKNKRRWKF